MRILYDIFFLLFSIFYLPYFLIKRKYHRDFLQRFGIFGKDTFSSIAATRPVWLHAVSVGEMKTAETLIKDMRRMLPAKRFVISNVTKTGHDIAVRLAGGEDIVIYFPIDLSFVVRGLVRAVNPSLFIAIETEIWPNLLTELYNRNIPAVLMNGRISPRSFRNYRLIKPVMRGILAKVRLFCMRTEADAERIRRLGAAAGSIKVTGNMKFDSVLIRDEGGEARAPVEERGKWLPEPSRLIVAGSTHRGEDAKILESYRALKKDFSDLRLLIAPRHIERVGEIEALAGRLGFKPVRISEVEKRCASAKSNPADYGDSPVFILDSMGRLKSFYKLATIVFMGGSLIPHGGQNFIEPAAYAKPVITGSYVHNFKDMSELFAKSGAIEIVKDKNGLVSSLRKLLSSEERCKEMGERAKKVVFDNIGSTERNISLIREYL